LKELIQSSGVQKKYTSTGKHSGYKTDLYHTGLKEHKHLSASELIALEGKYQNQVLAWERKWEKHTEEKKSTPLKTPLS
jgi:hypothetical protein